MGIFAALAVAFSLATNPAPVVRSFDLARSSQTVRFSFPVRAPAFRAVSLRIPNGANVRVFAQDAGNLAAVGTGTHGFWGGSCRQEGAFELCQSLIEGCPAPQGRWNAIVVKRTLRPARIRVSFLFSNHSG